MPEGNPIEDFEDCVFGESEEIYHPEGNSLLGDIMLALDLDEKPEKEWSRHEKRRMRRLSERLEEKGKDGLVHNLTGIALTDPVVMLALLGKNLPRPPHVTREYPKRKVDETRKQREARDRARGIPSSREMFRTLVEIRHELD
jgi:hypothetical protein